MCKEKINIKSSLFFLSKTDGCDKSTSWDCDKGTNWEVETPFQPVDTTFFKVLKYLLVYHHFLYQLNRHQWQLTTYIPYLILLVHSIGILYLVGVIHIKSFQISVLFWIGFGIPILWALVSSLFLIVTYNIILVLHKFSKILFLFLCSVDISKFTEVQQVKFRNTPYFNLGDTFLDITNILRDQLVEIQQTESCRASK